ncbi:MAG: phosphotransferase [Ectothiorhodospiraceae bacterium]|nr:phosphotransferase [Ectothiorhodospiraceae bacterium]
MMELERPAFFGKGSGAAALNIYRYGYLSGDRVFEKIYLKQDIANHVVARSRFLRQELGINTPKIIRKVCGEKVTILYFEFLDGEQNVGIRKLKEVNGLKEFSNIVGSINSFNLNEKTISGSVCNYFIYPSSDLSHEKVLDASRIDSEISFLRQSFSGDNLRSIIDNKLSCMENSIDVARKNLCKVMVLSHSDLKPRNLIMKEDSVFLIDLDPMAWRPLGFDLGKMLGHLNDLDADSMKIICEEYIKSINELRLSEDEILSLTVGYASAFRVASFSNSVSMNPKKIRRLLLSSPLAGC